MDSLGRLVAADASWGAEEQRRGRRTISNLKAQINDVEKTLEAIGYKRR